MTTSRFGSAVLMLLACAASGCRDETGASTAAGGFVEVGRDVGLRFKMEGLPGEQGENFKINLYDHGSGLAVADFDGDGFDDLYFLNQLGKNALYRNDGRGRFVDVTADAGVGLGDRVCLAATFGDVFGEGRQDLYVTSVRGGNVLFRNVGNGRFVDVTEESGLTLVAHSESAAFFDYDADGDLDLFVTNTAKWTNDVRDPQNRYYEGKSGLFELADSPVEHNVLYRNDGKGRFADVTAEAGVAGPGWGGDSAVFDYDADGRIDLFVGNMFGHSTLYHNEGGGKFTDVTATALGRTSWGAVGVKAFDYDGDGRLDLMSADMHSDMWMPISNVQPVIEEHRKYPGVEGPMVERGVWPESERVKTVERCRIKVDEVVFGNTLFRNLGGGRFEETSDKAGVETFWPWGIAAADFDLDGSVDLFVPSGMGYPLFYWRNYLLMSRGDGTFEDRGGRLGIDPPPGGQFLEKMIGSGLAPRSSRAAAVLDFDGDGRPDLAVANYNDRPYVYRNEFPKRSWLALKLTGTKSNRDAVGAVATVRAGGRVQVRQVDAASGYLSQSSKTLYFGLGGAGAVESCEVRWPSGAVQRVDAVKLSAVNVVVEAGGK
jgi:hypothetical protein